MIFADDEALLLKGSRERLSSGNQAREQTHREAVQGILKEVSAHPVTAVGHRVVHGGPKYHSAVAIDETVIADIKANITNAPSHNPYALMAIDAIAEAMPGVAQVALFDTAFHSRMPRRAKTYAIDHEVAEQLGIQRYGFHGISHEYVASIASDFLQRPASQLRLIILHLGNGASACAVEFGQSTETSMGNTPLEGLVMGSRSGDVDAGVLVMTAHEWRSMYLPTEFENTLVPTLRPWVAWTRSYLPVESARTVPACVGASCSVSSFSACFLILMPIRMPGCGMKTIMR